jgi:hypothetical protein
MKRARSQQLTVEETGIDLQQVNEYVYLGRVITAADNDVQALCKNIMKTRKRWGSLRRVLSRAGATPRISGYFYKAACQSVLLYGSETWVWTKRMLKTLESFHHQVARHISRNCIRKRIDENGEEMWVYPSTTKSMEKAGLRPIRAYVRKRREGLLYYAQTESTFYSHMLSLQRSTNQWWKQHHFLLESG